MAVRFLRAATTVVLGCLALSTFAQSPRPEVCDLAMKRGGLTLFAVDGIKGSDGESRIEDVRISGGDKEDELFWFCPGSGSIIPADPCTLKLTLVSSGMTYTLEEQRLHVVKYKDTFYAVTGWRKTEKGPSHTDVYRVERTGFRMLCSMVERPNSTVERDARKSGARPAP